MHVKLVSHSQPTAEFANLGITDAQELIAYCARVSNPANQFTHRYQPYDSSEYLVRAPTLESTGNGVSLL
jgi:hypothetical protein